MNKFLIPAALVATVIIAGIFAFMPVEKASTVHGTLASSSGQTTTDTNVDAEADGLNRAISFYLNMSHGNNRPGGNNVTIILSEPGQTFTGYAMLTAIPNNATGNDSVRTMNCGLQTTGEDGTRNKLGLNATAGMSNFTRFSAANGLTANEGIAVVLVNNTGASANNMVGVCAGTIVLTTWGS
ncbi:MAG: hypothetical protein HYZ56_03860 [Nitrosopumilales archaeon]|nr:hypothetical protein [Nitrosopumilales archaeon]